MSNLAILRIEINGRPATAEQLRVPALVNYGHFTAMQVRGGRVRGLDVHLARLVAATAELFGVDLDGGRVVDHVRHALADGPGDASVRVHIFRLDDGDSDGTVSIMVTIRGPIEASSTPVRLRSVGYQRPVPHIKHVGGFGQIYHGLRAERDGFDDALLTGPDGVVSESTIANIGFFDGTSVIWPDAPALEGTTMQLVEPRLPGAGLPSRRAPVRLADLPSYTAAFLTNSHGITPVGHIDDLAIPVDDQLVKTVCGIYESVPWDAI